MGIETFLTRLIQILTTETYNDLHGHLLVCGRSQIYETFIKKISIPMLPRCLSTSFSIIRHTCMAWEIICL